MRLLRMELQGYRSFLSPAVVDFSQMKPGLYQVRGRNEIEAELEANGAGKSTLFEAPHWCLYGKTSRGVRAGAIQSWNSGEQVVVMTDWETDNGHLSVLRTWGPNGLEVLQQDNPRPVDQREIDTLLFPEAVYSYCIYFAQFAQTFIDLSPSEQSAVFTDVLKLEIWEQAAKVALSDVTRIQLAARQLMQDAEGVKGRLQELADAGYEEAEALWAKQHAKDLKQAKADCAAADKLVIQCRVRLGEARVNAVEFKDTEKRAQAKARTMDQLENQAVRLAKEIKTLQEDDSNVCPTCGAPLDNKKHIQKEIITKQKELKTLKSVVAVARSDSHAWDIKLKQLARAGDALIEAEKSMAVAQANVRTLDAQLTDLQTAVNPHTAPREEADQRGEALVAEMERLEKLAHSLEAQHAATEYWVKGFKEIRLSLINESLAQLTIEANEVLYQMGLQDWRIEFDVERETKSGTINKNFTVMIHSPHTDAAVPWEAWSGGESQRLRLAITMGFANLVASRTGVQPNVEMWDEPSTGLSEAGIQDMLEVLADRAHRYSRVILLADHRTLDFGGFAGVITVVKDDKGSRIE